ncbi:MAG: dTDP-4-dehydrorhamnose reductase [Candidatus Omnitrophica bacterium]|nr:dTDP-4-dehydrorhamnose reductase [Candidatus Omnitrophota bacterium]
MEKIKKKKILITGATGLLGSSLTKILKPHYNLICFNKKAFDITNKYIVKYKLKKINPNVVIHCAAYTDVDKAQIEKDIVYKVNVCGTKNLVQNLKNKKSLFIYISTDYVFSGKKRTPYSENDRPSPINFYGKTKLEAEKEVLRLKKYIIIRTSWLYGPGGKNFIETIAKLAKQKKVIEVVNDQFGSPTYTIDLSKAIKELLDLYFKNKLPYGIYHITGRGRCSWFEFAKFAMKLINPDIKIMPVNSQKTKREAKRPKNSLLSNEKFYRLVGHYLPDWRVSVKHYIKNYLTKDLNEYFKK